MHVYTVSSIDNKVVLFSALFINCLEYHAIFVNYVMKTEEIGSCVNNVCVVFTNSSKNYYKLY